MTVELTRQQLAEFKETFALFDKDGSGSIDSSELGMLMNALGYRVNDLEAAALVRKVDADDSGEIDFKEFCALMQEELLKCDDEEELKSIYHMLDRNRDGGFSHAEIRLVFNEIGGTHAEITDEEINEMIWEADMSGDGEICYKEFKSMAEELGMIKPEHQAFRRSNGRSADDEEDAS